jgi:hypothetical protein
MLQRAFSKWLEKNRARFAVEIKLGRRTDTALEFSFAGIDSAISGALTTWEINVTVTHEDECWDFLLSLDAEPKRVQSGYICRLCPPDSRPVFPNRPSLWTAELFEPFLEWVNEDLAKAKWLVLEGSKSSMTRVTLVNTVSDTSEAWGNGGLSFPCALECPDAGRHHPVPTETAAGSASCFEFCPSICPQFTGGQLRNYAIGSVYALALYVRNGRRSDSHS